MQPPSGRRNPTRMRGSPPVGLAQVGQYRSAPRQSVRSGRRPTYCRRGCPGPGSDDLWPKGQTRNCKSPGWNLRDSARGIRRKVAACRCSRQPTQCPRSHTARTNGRTGLDKTTRANRPAGRRNGPVASTHVPASAGGPGLAGPCPRLGRTAATA